MALGEYINSSGYFIGAVVERQCIGSDREIVELVVYAAGFERAGQVVG